MSGPYLPSINDAEHEPSLPMMVRYEEFIRRLVAGQKPKQIAEELQMTEGAVQATIARANFRRMLQEKLDGLYSEFDIRAKSKKDQIQGKLINAADDMVDQIINLARSASRENVRLSAATTALEMTEELEIKRPGASAGMVINLTADVVELALRASKEIKGASSIGHSAESLSNADG